MDKIMELFGKGVAILMLLFINPIINGYVFIKLWAWLIVPTFNVQPLRIIEGVVILFMFSVLTFSIKKDSPENTGKSFMEKMLTSFITVCLKRLLFLGVGWIIHLFI